MPKNMNIKKAASALNQNQKQIKAALQGSVVTFAAVEKSLGRAQFLLKISTEKGVKTVTGSPRGLFTSGTMRIAAGQIAIVEGSEKLGFEIVARIDDLSDAQKLVKMGALPSELLAAAQVAGSKSGVTAEAEDDGLFDYSELQEGAAEMSGKGGVTGARKQREQQAAAAKLSLKLGSSSSKPSVRVESADDLSVFIGLGEEGVAKPKAKRPASQVARPPTPPTPSSKEPEVFLLWSGGLEKEDVAPVKPFLFKAPECWEDQDGINIDAI